MDHMLDTMDASSPSAKEAAHDCPRPLPKLAKRSRLERKFVGNFLYKYCKIVQDLDRALNLRDNWDDINAASETLTLPASDERLSQLRNVTGPHQTPMTPESLKHTVKKLEERDNKDVETWGYHSGYNQAQLFAESLYMTAARNRDHGVVECAYVTPFGHKSVDQCLERGKAGLWIGQGFMEWRYACDLHQVDPWGHFLGKGCDACSYYKRPVPEGAFGLGCIASNYYSPFSEDGPQTGAFLRSEILCGLMLLMEQADYMLRYKYHTYSSLQTRIVTFTGEHEVPGEQEVRVVTACVYSTGKPGPDEFQVDFALCDTLYPRKNRLDYEKLVAWTLLPDCCPVQSEEAALRKASGSTVGSSDTESSNPSITESSSSEESRPELHMEGLTL
ncbi:hypothetical protein QBC46DRAFT_450507 [Diplogelasinospora grovesii]|uniref:Uncharacterized protein n=1 Tax=Diplogelasinospora grovesii TaxID=303347 RepID=A0AAN6N7Q1_9PEZI|nr:hypothetical protein QBC46DRAFT_450507 [Diplogelasinospora grovesii]